MLFATRGINYYFKLLITFQTQVGNFDKVVEHLISFKNLTVENN